MNTTIHAAALAELRERFATAAHNGNEQAYARLLEITSSYAKEQEWVERYDMRTHRIATGELAEVVSEKCPFCDGTLYADANLHYYGGHGNTRQTFCLCGWHVVGRWVELATDEPLPV